MPSGYTAKIYDGATFNEFILGCARAFGALIHMRDDRMDEEITLPVSRGSDGYHAKGLKEDQERLAELEGMTDAQKQSGTEAHNAEQLAYYNKSMKEQHDKLSQLTSMLRQVNSWQPPTDDHKGLKEFMQKQISETIGWDCRDALENKKPPKPLGVDEWYAEEIRRVKWGIDYHGKHLHEDDDRNDGRREWIIHLFESIGLGDRVKNLNLKEVAF